MTFQSKQRPSEAGSICCTVLRQPLQLLGCSAKQKQHTLATFVHGWIPWCRGRECLETTKGKPECFGKTPLCHGFYNL